MRQEHTWHPAYAELKARFPGVKLDGGDMTPIQGRVCFHQERLLYGQSKAHAEYIRIAHDLGLPDSITAMTYRQCILALGCIEAAARQFPVRGRDVRTGWEDFTNGDEHGKE